MTDICFYGLSKEDAVNRFLELVEELSCGRDERRSDIINVTEEVRFVCSFVRCLLIIILRETRTRTDPQKKNEGLDKYTMINTYNNKTSNMVVPPQG